MCRDHGPASQIHVIGVVDLDATNSHTGDRPNVSDESRPATGDADSRAPFLMSHVLPMKPENLVLSGEIQNVGGGTRLGASVYPLSRAVAAVAQTDDQFEDVIRQSLIGNAELNRSACGDSAVGVQQPGQQGTALRFRSPQIRLRNVFGTQGSDGPESALQSAEGITA